MTRDKILNRRSFIKTSAIGVIGAGSLVSAHPISIEEEEPKGIPKIKGYRTLGRTGFKVSDIGIGTSRVYPVPVMNALLKAGVNYIDTGESYGRGAAEKSIGEAIKGVDRKSVFITTKVRMRGVSSKEQVLDKVSQCLQRMQTDYIDGLMIHGAPTVAALKDENFHKAMDQLKKEGKVRFIGVSNHGPRMGREGESMEKVLLGAIEDGRFDLLLLIYNFLQKEDGERILDAAAAKNIATTIMKSNPMGRYFQMKDRVEQMKKEGKALDERTQRYLKRMEETAKKAEPFLKKNNLTTPAEITKAALTFVLDNPKVNTLNLAFNNFEDVHNYLKLSGSKMGKNEKKTLASYKKNCSQLYCRHACGICEPHCPYHVPVNTIMRYHHYFDAQGSEKYAMEKYAQLETPKADLCKSCTGHCEQNCPHGVPIQGLLNMAHQHLTLA
jgi:predicted aldo/keto reductase-like oxidoreductase